MLRYRNLWKMLLSQTIPPGEKNCEHLMADWVEIRSSNKEEADPRF